MSASSRAPAFPIQGSYTSRWPQGQIPWEVAEAAYLDYSSRYGTSQSIERLAERSGFDWMELAQHLMGWHVRKNGPAWLEDLARSLGYTLAKRAQD